MMMMTAYTDIFNQHQQAHMSFMREQTLPWACSGPFCPSYHFIRSQGRTPLQQVIHATVGKYLTVSATKTADAVCAALRQAPFYPELCRFYGIEETLLTECYAALTAIITQQWPAIYQWTLPDLFSCVHACSMHFVTTQGIETDLYRHKKEQQNHTCQELYTTLHPLRDTLSFRALCYLTIRANWIDSYLGDTTPFLQAFPEEVNELLDRELCVESYGDTHPLFQDRHLYDEIAGKPKSVLYECDNNGEFFFDLLLIETWLERGHHVTIVTKMGPILNDVTQADCKAILALDCCRSLQGYRQNQQLRVITHGGSDAITRRYTVNEAYQQAYTAADLVILKGQANFESYPTYQRSLVGIKEQSYNTPHYYLFCLKSTLSQKSMRRIAPTLPMGSCVLYAPTPAVRG